MESQVASPQPALPDRKRLLEAKITVPDHVVHRAFVSETVVLNLRTGVYHGLNATAGRMLELLQETGSFGETADRLVVEYNRTSVEIHQDLRMLCGELLQRELIELA
jgi:hypothetical protein